METADDGIKKNLGILQRECGHKFIPIAGKEILYCEKCGLSLLIQPIVQPSKG